MTVFLTIFLSQYADTSQTCDERLHLKRNMFIMIDKHFAYLTFRLSFL